MKLETRKRREEEKREMVAKQELLANEAFQAFLRYLYSNAHQVQGTPHVKVGAWLPGWIITGCELYFTDVYGKVKSILIRGEESDG